MQNEKCKVKMEKEKNELPERLLDFEFYFSLMFLATGNHEPYT
jgi:hypothetical protein